MKRACLFFVLLVALPAKAAEARHTLGWQQTGGVYRDASQRERLATVGALYHFSGDTQGYTLALNRTRLTSRDGTADLHQNAVFLSGEQAVWTDPALGRVNLRLDLHAADNDDASGATDTLRVWAPQISWLSAERGVYVDLGYAHSRYGNGLRVCQWTPTLGLGFDDAYDWLTLRYWAIYLETAGLVAGPAKADTRSRAVELRWTHWLSPDNFLALHDLRVGVLSGTRRYAVDGDAGLVANLADRQRGGLQAGVEWRYGDLSLLLLAGRERYTSDTLAESYWLDYAYFWLATSW